ncbi:MAG: hypothetical protein HC945_00455 [Nitrosarchaeum sp.]|nr:hypothetical protein [Nitrosarchaeum sp.]
MSEKSTILLRKDTIKSLKNKKAHPRQSYDEVIRHMSQIVQRIKQR